MPAFDNYICSALYEERFEKDYWLKTIKTTYLKNKKELEITIGNFQGDISFLLPLCQISVVYE